MPAELIVQIFNRCFGHAERTVLLGGADEPLYVPAASAHDAARIYFKGDSANSALHEVAHWCLAGPRRRQQLDYGYWYYPDGRTSAEQRAFELVEVKPQALEKVLAMSCGISFAVSADNLNAQHQDLDQQAAMQRFAGAVELQAAAYLTDGLPRRAYVFAQSLVQYFGTSGMLPRPLKLRAQT